MVDHRELFEGVTMVLARAGFDTAPGPSRLRIGHRPEGVVVDWSPDGLPPEGVRAAVLGAVAAVLRESGHRVAEADGGGLLVTVAEVVTVPAEPPTEAEAAPEHWWG
ncbi:hypothetical protein F7Q99_00750 [Streptomyces kaniharaensis]|uniref:Uncharacterized protein n=1 Tax=Streptomyces kaniharaensis TaxID=212423 RepID=A0A6N7KKW5_9ACTN|nr:hypothetical protein [Streptomyces kaniharaensis]MQS10844.1 hypothetical protein [Streptomyces kaniharaensis]